MAGKEKALKYIVHSPNWLGDVVMSFPAFAKWRTSLPAGSQVFVLAKEGVAGIWKYAKDVAGLVVLRKDCDAAAVREVSALGCDKAVVLPQSFRAARIVRGVPERRGTAGQFRFFMVNDRVSLRGLERAHQQFEYARIFGLADGAALPPPSDAVDTSRLPSIPDFCPAGGYMVVLPGAARGPSKRWPPEFFAKAVADFISERKIGVVICGTAGEAAECATVKRLLDDAGFTSSVNACAKTRLGELSAVLAGARVVLSNDSGGMHLATAMGAPVVGVFGITDYEKTGPLGTSRVVAAEGVRRSRRIPRESAEAERALRSIPPGRVVEALREVAR